MLEAFASARPEVVYHLAAQIDVRRSVDDPSTDAHQNVGGTAAVLEAARARRRAARRARLDRRRLRRPAGAADRRGRARSRRSRPTARARPRRRPTWRCSAACTALSTLSLRMSNVYGPRQNPHGEAGVIAIFCAAAAERRPVTIFGDGTQTRDFVYVEDVVRGVRGRGPLGRAGRDQRLHRASRRASLELAGGAGPRDDARARSASARSAARASTRRAAAARLGWSARDAAGRGPAAHARLA